MTPLESARAVAISYRNALYASDPDVCRFLDEKAIAAGHGWVAPMQIPKWANDPAVLDAELSATDIEHYWCIPASTVRTWANRGRIQKRSAPNGAPAYRLGDVLAAQAGTRRTESAE